MKRRIHGLVGVAAVLAIAGAAVAAAQTGAFGVGSPTLNKNGSARLPVTFPSAGTAVIRDVYVEPGRTCSPPKRIKTFTTQIAAAGLVELRVIPVGKAKRKIADGKTVKVGTQIGFTPTGGTTTTQNKTIKLHKTTGGDSVHSANAASCGAPNPSGY
jgi:hypothetical protein